MRNCGLGGWYGRMHQPALMSAPCKPRWDPLALIIAYVASSKSCRGARYWDPNGLNGSRCKSKSKVNIQLSSNSQLIRSESHTHHLHQTPHRTRRTRTRNAIPDLSRARRRQNLLATNHAARTASPDTSAVCANRSGPHLRAGCGRALCRIPLRLTMPSELTSRGAPRSPPGTLSRPLRSPSWPRRALLSTSSRSPTWPSRRFWKGGRSAVWKTL